MRIDSMTLRNFRRFEHLEATFHPNLNVIVGENGTGKTTVLDALTSALEWFKDHMPGVSWNSLTYGDVSYGKSGDSLLSFVFNLNGKSSNVGHILREGEYFFNKYQSDNFFSSYCQVFASSSLDREIVFPLIRVFSAKRQWSANNLSNLPIGYSGERFFAYNQARDNNLLQDDLIMWMVYETYKTLQAIHRKKNRDFDPFSVLNVSLESCIDGFDEMYYSIEQNGLVIVWKTGVEELFSRLSDGQKNIIALVADLAWRAALLNPQLGAEAAAKTPGVVLIDELELHLHPAWQRRIVSDLRKAFPLVQFFGTTHSPQIISEVPRECLRVLRMDGTISKPDAFIEGRDSNAILEEVMGVSSRPEDAADALDQITAMLDEERFEEARGAIEALRARLGPHDRDLRVAKMRLEMEAP